MASNLGAARIEYRGEGDADVAPHVHAKEVELVVVQPSGDAQARARPGGLCRDEK